VIVYHKISNDFEYGLTTVRIQKFREQMQYLYDNNYETVTVSAYQNNIPASKNPIIICFDDAYESVYTNAYPILKSFGFTAILFPVTDYIGKMNTWDANISNKKFMHANWAQLEEMINNGWTIACHSSTHMLKKLKQNYFAEIAHSKQILESTFRQTVNIFAYPFSYRLKSINDTIEKDFAYIFTMISYDKSTEKNIPRIPVYGNDNLKSFEKKLKLDKFAVIQSICVQKGSRLTIVYQNIFK
jgi:peptidoglycan/xylan/chitin deacetylase (PgdA/CDA1 family)